MLEKFQSSLQKIENYLTGYFSKSLHVNQSEGVSHRALARLEESIGYSVIGGIGKRFRPLLSLLVARSLGHFEDRILPLGLTIELIHTYSLIHDDLPSMDNDDKRRGKPTNHKVYGEAVALLAGDALQSEAFLHIAESYGSQPEMAVELTILLSKAIGVRGMVGGQAIDMYLVGTSRRQEMAENLSTPSASHREVDPSLSMEPLSTQPSDVLYQLHRMKTGALIRVATEGAAVICKASPEVRFHLKEFGEKLGMAFQLADDILDYSPEIPEKSGWPSLVGLDETRSQLDHMTQEALALLSPLGEGAQDLKDLALWNAHRVAKEL